MPWLKAHVLWLAGTVCISGMVPSYPDWYPSGKYVHDSKEVLKIKWSSVETYNWDESGGWSAGYETVAYLAEVSYVDGQIALFKDHGFGQTLARNIGFVEICEQVSEVWRSTRAVIYLCCAREDPDGSRGTTRENSSVHCCQRDDPRDQRTKNLEDKEEAAVKKKDYKLAEQVRKDTQQLETIIYEEVAEIRKSIEQGVEQGKQRSAHHCHNYLGKRTTAGGT